MPMTGTIVSSAHDITLLSYFTGKIHRLKTTASIF